MHRTTRWGLPALAAVAAPLLVPAGPAPAAPAEQEDDALHCYAEALTSDEVAAGLTSDVWCVEEPVAFRASIVLAIHYTSPNGSGADVTIYGSTCANAGTAFSSSSPFDNNIESTYNGSCANAKHFANANQTGANETTTGAAHLHDLTTLANQTSSVAYS